jgi:hypothetical protein
MPYPLNPVIYQTGEREEMLFDRVGEKKAFEKISSTLIARIKKRKKGVSRETPLGRTQLPPGAADVLPKHEARLLRVVGLASIERLESKGPVVIDAVPLPDRTKVAA